MVLEVRKDTGQTFGLVTRVAKELGIGSESLRKWVAQAEIDGGATPGTSTVDSHRLAALERDNRDLRRANAQYTSIAYTERLAELGADASIGTVGDSYDNALAETVNGLYKAELVRNPVVLTPTAATGRASTTSRSPPAAGSAG